MSADVGAVVRTASPRRRAVGDVWGGLTVAALVIPLSMGLAVTAGLAPEHGLYASVLPMLVFAAFASSRRTMIGPDASVTALIVAVVVPAAHDRGVDLAQLVAALAIMSGVLCVAASRIGAGRLANVFDEFALVGYLAGLAVVVAVAQLPRITGIELDATATLQSAFEALRRAAEANVASTIVGIATCAFVLLARQWRPAWPWMPLGVAVATAAVIAGGLDEHGVRQVGQLPSGLPGLQLPRASFGDLVAVVPVAVAIAAVTFADTVATATAFAVRHHEPDDPGRDLTALGLADIAAGVSGGMPVSASGARTAAASAAGATTQRAGAVGAAFVLIALTGAGRVLSELPLPALGGIVVAAVVPMVDVAAMTALRATDRRRYAGAFLVAGAVIVVGVLQGVVVALAASLVLRRIDGSSPRADHEHH